MGPIGESWRLRKSLGSSEPAQHLADLEDTLAEGLPANLENAIAQGPPADPQDVLQVARLDGHGSS